MLRISCAEHRNINHSIIFFQYTVIDYYLYYRSHSSPCHAMPCHVNGVLAFLLEQTTLTCAMPKLLTFLIKQPRVGHLSRFALTVHDFVFVLPL